MLGLAASVMYLIHAACKPAESIGIIGGADGPTAVFLAERLASPLLMAILPFALAMFIGTVLIITALILHITGKKPVD